VARGMCKKSVEDIIEQLQVVHARALDVSEAKDIGELNVRLEALEQSTDILRMCVSVLRCGASSHPPRPIVRRKNQSKM
jgi:hypothetical protein